jgi:hypothetical protein
MTEPLQELLANVLSNIRSENEKLVERFRAENEDLAEKLRTQFSAENKGLAERLSSKIEAEGVKFSQAITSSREESRQEISLVKSDMQKLSENVDKRLDGHIYSTKQVQEELARKVEVKNREVDRDLSLMRKDIDKFRQEVTEKDQAWKDKLREKMSRLDDNIKAVCNENTSKIDR